jgi:hypothetical protein
MPAGHKNPTLENSKSHTPYKVFVSSTYLDNKERRKAVQEAITMAEMACHGMEIFTAGTRPTVEEYLRHAGRGRCFGGNYCPPRPPETLPPSGS